MVFLIPLLTLLLAVAAMSMIIWKFIHFQWADLRDAMARLWNGDRRTVLHLESQNGFIVLSELLMRQSELLLHRVSVFLLCPSLFAGGTYFLTGMMAWLLTMILYNGMIWYIAMKKQMFFTSRLAEDGFGTFARTESEWRSYAIDKKALFLMSLGFFIVLGVAWISYSLF